MGLDVHAEDKEGVKGSSFYAGAYSRFMRFRQHLILAIRGAAAAMKHRQDVDQAMFEMIAGKHANNPVFRQLAGLPPVPAAAAAAPRAPKEPDLDILLKHSDCDGEFNADECERLYAVFRKHKSHFKKSKPEEGFVELYEDFMDAFKIGKDGGKVVFS